MHIIYFNFLKDPHQTVNILCLPSSKPLPFSFSFFLLAICEVINLVNGAVNQTNV